MVNYRMEKNINDIEYIVRAKNTEIEYYVKLGEINEE